MQRSSQSSEANSMKKKKKFPAQVIYIKGPDLPDKYIIYSRTTELLCLCNLFTVTQFGNLKKEVKVDGKLRSQNVHQNYKPV